MPCELPTHLQADVEVQEADGAPLAQLVLLLRAAHLHDAQRLGLRGEGLHAQRLQAVLREAEGKKRKGKEVTTDTGLTDCGKQGVATTLRSVDFEL